MRRRSFAKPCLLLAAACCCLPLACPPAQARTVYGYEDSLGMLHTSPNKLNAHYKPLYDAEAKADHAALMRALREQNALGGPPITRGAVLPADMGPLSEVGQRILRAAEPYLGAPYRLGGDTPAGIDCSGLTKAVYASFGCSLPRQSRLQAGLGSAVATAELAPGDLLFFATNLDVGISHVGIYLGSGRMLHSSPRRGGVGVDKLSGTDYERWFVAARRLPRAPGADASDAGAAGRKAGRKKDISNNERRGAHGE